MVDAHHLPILNLGQFSRHHLRHIGFLYLDYAFHVDGYLDIKTRKEIIYKLSNEDEKTIVTNAKLFSEGIDIPAIELIGFLNRTKSIVDIAQRVGRVQRKRFEDDNEPGYIFIPLFEDKNSNIYIF